MLFMKNYLIIFHKYNITMYLALFHSISFSYREKARTYHLLGFFFFYAISTT